MKIKFNRNLGMILLAVWLIYTGLEAFVPAIRGLGTIAAIVAVAAGILILIGR